MSSLLERTIVESLREAMAIRERNAAFPEGCKPIIPGVTHCESCGFHRTSSQSVVLHRDACSTPEWHLSYAPTRIDAYGVSHTLIQGFCSECGETEDWIRGSLDSDSPDYYPA